MAKTKAELIEEATGRGIDLEGTETVEQLKTMLSRDEDGDPAPKPMPDPVAVSKAKLEAAKTALVEAEADHKRVVAENTPAEEQADPDKHVLVDNGGTGSYGIMEVPAGIACPCRERALLLPGLGNVEHVGEQIVMKDNKPIVVWTYRKM